MLDRSESISDFIYTMTTQSFDMSFDAIGRETTPQELSFFLLCLTTSLMFEEVTQIAIKVFPDTCSELTMSSPLCVPIDLFIRPFFQS